jgi:hypothetical protein
VDNNEREDMMLGFPTHSRMTSFSLRRVCLYVTAIFWPFLLSPAVCIAGMVTYSFDDGHINTYEVAVPILESQGQVGTINAVLTWVGNVDRMSLTQLLEVEAKGWEICSQSVTHPKFDLIPQRYEDELLTGWSPTGGTSYTYQTSHTYDQLNLVLQDGDTMSKRDSVSEVEANPDSFYFDLANHIVYVHTSDSSSPATHEMRAVSVERELEYSKQEFRNIGLNVQNFVVPHSQWNATRALVAKKFYHTAAAAGGPPPDELNVNPLPLQNPGWLARRVIHSDTSIETAKAWVDSAASQDIWLILMFHGVCDTDADECWPTANLQALVEYVANLGISVVTQEQGYEMAKARSMPWLILLID